MGWWGDNVPEETLSRDEATQVIRRLLRMLRPQRGAIVVATLVLMAQAAALLAGPLLVALRHRQGPAVERRQRRPAALNLAVGALPRDRRPRAGARPLAIVLVARIGESFLRDLRNRLFGHMMSLSLDYFETEKTGRIVARMTSDIDAMQELISQGLVLFVQNIFLFVGAVDRDHCCCRGSSRSACWSSCRPCSSRAAGSGACRTRRTSTCAIASRPTSATLQEGLEGVRVVQAFGRERVVHERFQKTNEDQYEANMETTRISAKYFPFIEYAGVAAPR